MFECLLVVRWGVDQHLANSLGRTLDRSDCAPDLATGLVVINQDSCDRALAFKSRRELEAATDVYEFGLRIGSSHGSLDRVFGSEFPAEGL